MRANYFYLIGMQKSIFPDSNANDFCLLEKITIEAVLLCYRTLISFVFSTSILLEHVFHSVTIHLFSLLK